MADKDKFDRVSSQVTPGLIQDDDKDQGLR